MAAREQKFSYRCIKDVYTIVLFENSPPECKEFPNSYIHHGNVRFDTGIKIHMPQDFFYISLDIFRGILHNRGITDDLDAWLTFLCQEEPDLPYDDGARTLFLYTKGTRGRSRKKLRELLCYMKNSTDDNAVNPGLRKIHHMVEKVELDKGVSLKYLERS